MTASRLTRLLAPRSVAFIGGLEAETALRVTRQLGFTGNIHAVHPKREHLDGVPCLRRVADLPEVPDCAFIAVKREPAVAMVEELAAMGCGGIVLYASGFAELGDDGKELEARLRAVAGTMPIMGPNCYGYVNALDQVSPWPDEHGLEPVTRGIAIVTQSGNIACNFAMMRRHVPVAGLFTLGNQADVGMSDMVEHLAGDDRISAIGLHIEGLKDIAHFSRAALAARAAGKPVVVLKTGRSEQGAKVAMSHTNSLSGADDLYDAMFTRYGIARVKSVSALIETLKLLHFGGPLTDARLISCSCSGGEAALISDMALDYAVKFPDFAAQDRDAVAATLNEYVVIANPLDYHTFIWNQRERLAATFTAVMRCDFDAAMLIIDVPHKPPMDPKTWLTTVDGWIDAHAATGARALTVTSLHESLPPETATRLAEAGIAPMQGLDDCLTALSAAAFIGRAHANPEPPNLDAPAAMIASAPVLMTEGNAKNRLAAYGIAIPKSAVTTPDKAAAAADAIGYPVVVKASSTTLAHKTEAGGVALNLANAAAVEAAAKAMRNLSDQVLVEQMVTGAVCELIVGVKRDPQFGLSLVVGAGGILTELLRDTATLLLPTSRDEIVSALRALKAWRLIEGYRGKSGDLPATIDAIAAVAHFALDHADTLEELDINPLLVCEPGHGAIAADALMRIRQN